VEISRVSVRKIIEKLLKIFGIDSVIHLNHAFTRQRFYHSIQLEGFKQPLYLDQGFDFLQGNSPARACPQTTSTFVLSPITNF
jgi:hypothetical protein